MTTTVTIQQLPHSDGMALPNYETAQAAGMDLAAAIDTTLTLAPGERQIVPTGIAIALPAGLEAQVRPRSGLAAKQGVTVLNAPGTIDADYRGEVGVILVNLGQDDVQIERGDRIAQLVIAPVLQVDWEPVASLPETVRGTGGFGSTGVAESGGAG
jgi:dUTP pyrophosphatase